MKNIKNSNRNQPSPCGWFQTGFGWFETGLVGFESKNLS